MESMDRSPSFFGKVAKTMDNETALEREFICDALRILFTPSARLVKGARTQEVLPEGFKHAFEDADRAEPSFLRVFGASYG